jgi:hypothetical protein
MADVQMPVDEFCVLQRVTCPLRFWAPQLSVQMFALCLSTVPVQPATTTPVTVVGTNPQVCRSIHWFSSFLMPVARCQASAVGDASASAYRLGAS